MLVSRWGDFLNINKKAKIKYTLVGVNPDGSKFRPSAWAEMLVCQSRSQRKIYDGHLVIYTKGGIRGIKFDDLLHESCPITFERLISFARINKLVLEKEDLS